MNMLLTGASGFIGHHILQELEKQEQQVLACCRSANKLFFKSNNTSILEKDFILMTNPTDWLPYLDNIDVVINCVGIISESSKQTFELLHSKAPTALFKAAELAGVKKIIQVSALGANESAVSNYHLSKKSADDVLRKLDLDWTILQPSIVYGAGAQSMALFHALAASPIHMLIDGGQQKIQPIHVNDVVATILQCLDPKSSTRHTLPLVGPKAISFKHLLQQLRLRLGKTPASTISIAAGIAEKTVFLGKWLGEPTFNAENINMLRQGNTADVKPITKFLGRAPVSLQQQLLSIPATQAERWHAGLYFLRPLLRLSIAFLWLWSGMVSIFLYPPEQSYQLLAASSITGLYAPIMLYGLALLDIAFGLATLLVYRIRPLIFLQLSLIFLYTLAISLSLPEFWIHPFGAVLKNIPLFATLLVYLTLEGEKP